MNDCNQGYFSTLVIHPQRCQGLFNHIPNDPLYTQSMWDEIMDLSSPEIYQTNKPYESSLDLLSGNGIGWEKLKTRGSGRTREKYKRAVKRNRMHEIEPQAVPPIDNHKVVKKIKRKQKEWTKLTKRSHKIPAKNLKAKMMSEAFDKRTKVQQLLQQLQ